MLELITLEQARYQCMVDADDSGGSPHDPWLIDAIREVSDAVALWLKDSWRLYVPAVDSSGEPIVDSSGEPVPAVDSNGPIVRPAVQRAVKLEVASQFRFREGEGDNDMPQGGRSINGQGHGYTLGRGATNILASLRKPTVA